jgi:hypothetical protein
MPNAENQHDQAVIFDPANEPVIPNTVFPELPKPRTVQRFSDAAGIVQQGDSVLQELENAPAVLRVEPAKFPVGRRR